MTQGCRVVAIGEILWYVFDDATNPGRAPLNFAAHTARLGHPALLIGGTLPAYREQSRGLLRALASALPRASKESVQEFPALADVVKLSETEMESVAAFTGFPSSRVESFCTGGAARFGWKSVAVTLEANGCAVRRSGEYSGASGYRVPVVDAVGAGDCSAVAIADFANRLASPSANRPGGISYWTVDELRIPGQPSGPAPASSDAARFATPVQTPRATGVPWDPGTLGR